MARPIWLLKLGEEAPAFRMPATGRTAGRGQKREDVGLAEFRGNKNVVMAFYPAAFTPV